MTTTTQLVLTLTSRQVKILRDVLDEHAMTPVDACWGREVDEIQALLRTAHEGEKPSGVLLPVEARKRGFRNVLSFRRWCRSRGVAIHKDGRREWISPTAVDETVMAMLQNDG